MTASKCRNICSKVEFSCVTSRSTWTILPSSASVLRWYICLLKFCSCKPKNTTTDGFALSRKQTKLERDSSKHFKQECLAVVRIVRDDENSSTNLSPAVMQLRGRPYALFCYSLYARQLRKFCYTFYTSAVYVRCGAVLGRCGN